MQVSEARLAANRANSLKAKGPTSTEGKAASRRGAIKHGLSGGGVVVSECDREEIDRRVEALTADMKPRSPAGVVLIAQMASLSVRAERAARQECAAIAMHVRHAADAFDEERIERAERLLGGLADDPRAGLRKLRKMPEGVELLIDAWDDLRGDLAADDEPDWTDQHLERAANLAGLKARHARGSRLGALSRGLRGDFSGLSDGDSGGLEDHARRAWSRAGLIERIDAEIASLEAHYETLDFETIELDRAEAGQRALFDPSKGATLARRYEAELRRGFFKALAQFRQVEAESEAQAQAESPAAATPTILDRPDARMGSFRQERPKPGREAGRVDPDAPMPDFPAIPGPHDRPSRDISPVKSPG